MFFFNDTATTEIYTLSLHDALPIWGTPTAVLFRGLVFGLINALTAAGIILVYRTLRVINFAQTAIGAAGAILTFNFVQYTDRKSTRLNSSHANISYAVFCLKKKTYI